MLQWKRQNNFIKPFGYDGRWQFYIYFMGYLHVINIVLIYELCAYYYITIILYVIT